ncbi:hypothetical protein FA15DRAFT_707698 [Coprinopsis marcescibilis]|uniref:DUF6593 domain-containing protein n=1 Tax=Coprinopsis marcescibilis TaxID=230819 RepID=A0A5C3KKN8_COPMA|nr:hypothetical protein FA15DRAFT_707698 [Coprinopsis marcescibilis]
MRLILDGPSPLYSTYFTEDGAPIYEIELHAGAGFLDRKTRIHKMHVESGNFLPFAEFELHSFNQDRLRMGTIFDVSADEMFRCEPGIYFSGDDRIFLGPDNREYRWIATSRKVDLVVNDDTGTLVAKFHHKHHEIFSFIQEPCPASFEIFPPGEHMIDLIMLTFIYAEIKRQHYRERRQKRRDR